MQYYLIKTSIEKTIIGPEYPQIQTMGGNVNRDAPNSLYNVYSNEFPSFVPNLNYFILHKNANLTDVLSAAMISYGFIVNNKVKNILEQFNLPPHIFYSATVEHNGKFYDNYFWFFFTGDILDFIDYDRTKFYITDMVDNKIEDCKNINSVISFKNLKEILPDDRDINSDLIFLKKSTLDNYDLIKIPFGNYRSYVSEKLFNKLNIDITGFSFSEVQNILL